MTPRELETQQIQGDAGHVAGINGGRKKINEGLISSMEYIFLIHGVTPYVLGRRLMRAAFATIIGWLH